MKCAKLHLQERSRPRKKLEVNLDKPRRFCQRRMINPDHEEDPRWNAPTERFHCNVGNETRELNEPYDSVRIQQEVEDLFLTVQNLQFKGDIEHRKRPRTSFKYKTLTDGKKHRMFVKQIVNFDNDEVDRLSELTYYYIDDYEKYFISSDRSRPSSGKSGYFFDNVSNKTKENKATQVDIARTNEIRKAPRPDTKAYISLKKDNKLDCKDDFIKEPDNNNHNNMEDSTISFHKRGKRKSLTISRTECPATVQVIRVDVVCNYSCSSTMSDYEDKKQIFTNDLEEKVKNKETIKVKNTRFANKYILTNTVKTLDENVSSGAKVTLLCKTFRLEDRSKLLSGRKLSNSVKNILFRPKLKDVK